MSRLMLGGSLMCGSGEARVSSPASPAPRHREGIARLREIVQNLAGFGIVNDGTQLRGRVRALGHSSEFAGEQFLLWWMRGSDGGAIESLAFFLNPSYSRPTGRNVKTVMAAADLTGDLSAYDTLDFEGTIAIGLTGNVAFLVPDNILNIFFGPSAWVKGKLRFTGELASSMTRGLCLRIKAEPAARSAQPDCRS
jgi:hypothetical protein